MIKRRNVEIYIWDYNYLSPNWIEKMNLGGHELGPFAVLDRTEWKLLIQRGDLFERVNRDRVRIDPTPCGEITRTTEF